MVFVGGFVGVAQNEETLRVRFAVGWAVRDAAGPAEPVREASGWAPEPRLPPEATPVAGRSRTRSRSHSMTSP
jgi:hypothetical protein